MHDFEKGLMIGTVITTILWISFIISTQKDYKQEAIKHQCAQYNPQTAKFEWIKENKLEPI